MVFNKLVSFQLDYASQYHISKYVSPRTKLQLVHINHKSSPLVEGYFAVATECPNDSGVPHTLEHLLFMGSKKYPYKGLLDTVGNLCMSSTNAWTATDQTVYTLTSAGWKGFKKLLPVYLDHLLSPTLTDEACVTEVYHVDPEDLTDKGVVYSEMEGIESQSWFLASLEKQRLMFPEGSGYRSETGGLTKNLRELTNEEIRNFHKEMYSAQNLCLIITGNVPERELLDIVGEWDATLPTYESEVIKRPFVDTLASQIPEKRDSIIQSTVEFPESDESLGEILLSWIGEKYDAYEADLAVTMLLEYFTDSSISPFNMELVEIDDPYANSVDYYTDDYLRTIINLNLHGVPTEKLQLTTEKALEIFANHKIDLTRLRQVITNSKWEFVMRCEKNASDTLSQAVISDFLYGTSDGTSLTDTLKSLEDYDTLINKWTVTQWEELTKKIFVDNKPVIVVGKPSSKMNEDMETEKEKLLKSREEKYGESGRRDLATKLEAAKKRNDVEIPKNILDSFSIENPAASVDFIDTESREHQTSKNFPIPFHIENFPSRFVEVHCLLNTMFIKDTSLLPYYQVFHEIFSLPMKSTTDGGIIPYEEVVAKLKTETLDAKVTLGLSGACPDLIDIMIRCRADDYASAVEWFNHVLFDMVFDENRIKVMLENYLDSIVELKREGVMMLESIGNRNLYNERSLKKSVDPLYSESFLEEVLESIEAGDFEDKVLPKLETMRSQLRTHFTKFRILLLGDVAAIGGEDSVYEPWNGLLSNMEKDNNEFGEHKIPPAPRLLNGVSDICKNPNGKAFIITTPASESSYMNVITKVPFDLDYHHEDYAKVSLASEYLQCVEGPFWKGIRGAGLAYGANMLKLTEINSWGFSIYRGADIIGCYKAGKEIVDSFAQGKSQFEPLLMEGAMSSIINHMATVEDGYFNAGLMKYVDDNLYQRGPDFKSVYLKKLSEVTISDLEKMMKKYLINLFDSQKSVVFVSCHPSKLESVQEFLESEGFEVEVEELEEDDSEAESDVSMEE
ncbi:hypothetical protein RNJ44_01931 [Nakaseomyces bracarensis]|uniref:Uncharacterized protein n=1 Tax=Nakaseomyces bracarensis TaxID=273131 RepID=A0ABR4NP63_9SACH